MTGELSTSEAVRLLIEARRLAREGTPTENTQEVLTALLGPKKQLGP